MRRPAGMRERDDGGGTGRSLNLVDVERRLREFAEIFQCGGTSSAADVRII